MAISDDEMVLMNEGDSECVNEEDIVDMVEKLMIDESPLKEISEDSDNNDMEMKEIDDEEQDDAILEGIYSFAGNQNKYHCLDNKWWEQKVLASGGDTNYTDYYNWCSEDDMKTWELSEYSCTHPI